MSFDAFNNDVGFQDDSWYGEIIVPRGFMAVFMSGWQEYDESDILHQEWLQKDNRWGQKNKFRLCFEVQHFPDGVSFDTWPSVWPATSKKDWVAFEQSLADSINYDISTKLGLKNFRNKHLRKLTQGGNYFNYTTPVIRTYKNADGDEKQVRGIVVKEWFASYDEMIAAKETNRNSDLPADTKVEAKKVETLAKEQALGLVATIAKSITDEENCWTILQGKFDERPMFANLHIDDEDVKQAAIKANDIFGVEF